MAPVAEEARVQRNAFAVQAQRVHGLEQPSRLSSWYYILPICLSRSSISSFDIWPGLSGIYYLELAGALQRLKSASFILSICESCHTVLTRTLAAAVDAIVPQANVNTPIAVAAPYNPVRRVFVHARMRVL